jgi:hypothetical protein
MVLAYHKQYILLAVGWLKRNTGGTRFHAPLKAGQVVLGFGLLQLAGCDAVQIVENADTHVSIRYDGIMNGLDQATDLAKRACAVHGRTAKLQKVYYEGLGAGERFAFFDCV